jgi:hypothetical protein
VGQQSTPADLENTNRSMSCRDTEPERRFIPDG